jgi:hypothetical protein
VRIVVITIEGVLTEAPADLKVVQPRKMARDLYNGLRTNHRIILLSNQSDNDLARYWLRKEGFVNYAVLMCYPATSVSGVVGWKVNTMREMLGDGWDVGLFVDTSAPACGAILSEGVPVMLVSYPSIRPGRLPETPGPPRSWDDIAATVEAKNLLEQGG